MSSQRAPTIKPDFDTDVLWKPPIAGRRMSRGLSTDSSDSENVRRVSVTEMGTSSPPTVQPITIQPGPAVGVDPPRARRMSFTEMIFGSPGARKWSWGEKSYMEQAGKTGSVTEDERFKEIMRHQNKILNDEGGLSGFKTSDYRKE